MELENVENQGIISSSYFIPRENDEYHNLFKRVRIMPLYSFPPLKEFDLKITEHINRFFIHLDLDCFYAQVEQRDNPNLKDKPVSVGSSRDGKKGIVMTCSYEARALGIDIGMSTFEARQKCPQLICVPCCGPKYEHIIRRICEIVEEHLPPGNIERYSIDECFIDLSPVCRNYKQAEELCHLIKLKIWREERLTVSIGLSYNKTYAKIATKFMKPAGFTIVKKETRDELIYPLIANKIWGIGNRNEKRLWKYCIYKIGDIANAPIGLMRKEFGINGYVFWRLARGEDTSGLIATNYRKQNKSLGHHHSLNDTVYTKEDVSKEWRRIIEYVCRKMRVKGLVGKEFSMSIRFEDLTYTAAKGKFHQHTNDDREVFQSAIDIMNRLYAPSKSLQARQFGMFIWDLQKDLQRKNLHLFGNEPTYDFPFHEMDMLKDRYGDNIIRIGVEQ